MSTTTTPPHTAATYAQIYSEMSAEHQYLYEIAEVNDENRARRADLETAAELIAPVAGFTWVEAAQHQCPIRRSNGAECDVVWRPEFHSEHPWDFYSRHNPDPPTDPDPVHA